MRTLVTGASGYIGLHIVRELLEHRHQVTAVVRSPEKLGPFASNPRLRVVRANLEDDPRIALVLPDHDVCVHAALIWGEPGSEYEARDVSVTARLFQAAANAGCRRGIYISSAAVHRPFSREMCEEDGLRTPDIYGATKAAGELFLRAACAHGGMTGIVIRPGPVVGPPAFPGGSFRSPNRILEMMSAAAGGLQIDVVRGEGRQFSEVSIVAKVVRLLSRKEKPYPTYLCVDREVVPWERIARMIVACFSSSRLSKVVARDSLEPAPRFRTDRIESLLGGPTNAQAALLEHIRYVMRERMSQPHSPSGFH